MIYLAFIAVDLLLPGFLLFWLYRSRARSRVYLASVGALVLLVLLVLTFSVVGAWYLLGTFWIWVFAVAFVAGGVYRVRRGLPNYWWPARGSREMVLAGVNLVFMAALSICLFLVTRAHAYEREPLSLAAPLRGPGFYVMGGGANWAVNHHFIVPEQEYAVDITQVNRLGFRAASLWPSSVQEIYIYGAEILAPCDGEVIATHDGLPNRALMNPDFDSPYGNHVVIFCGAHTVVLAHMTPGTVTVRVGEQVRTGQRLGQVGNSGSTFEPHLHVHAVEGRREDGAGVATPLLIDGEFLIKGETFGTDESPLPNP